MPSPGLVIHAHRGAHREHQENTLGAYRAALAAGADWIEADVRLSADGVPVFCHDRDFVRLAARPEVLADDCSSVWLTEHFGAEDAEDRLAPPVAIVVHVLAEARFNLEVKTIEAVAPLVGALDAHCPGWRARVLLSGFSRQTLGEARTQASDVPRAWCVRGWPQELAVTAETLGLSALHPKTPLVEPARVAAARALGLGVVPYTLNDPAVLRRWQANGIELTGVITDDVRAFVAARSH